ncbi:MAG: transcription repressor NadR [Lachnospiraceae bacterium]|nr:transcription repressor NadR [Lachnospiraceae bacterium]
MEQVLSGSQRRKKIVDMLKQSPVPLSGTALGRETGVSRQVVVQDMALLRSQGYDIMATPRGYVLDAPSHVMRIIKVFHTDAQIEEELTAIVDLGGCVEDVMVNHRAYGKIVAPLNVRNRRDVQSFMNKIKTGKSTSLLNVTSGYHFHRISAESEEILDEIEEALKENGMLAEILPYEKELIEI